MTTLPINAQDAPSSRFDPDREATSHPGAVYEVDKGNDVPLLEKLIMYPIYAAACLFFACVSIIIGALSLAMVGYVLAHMLGIRTDGSPAFTLLLGFVAISIPCGSVAAWWFRRFQADSSAPVDRDVGGMVRQVAIPDLRGVRRAVTDGRQG